MLRAYAAGATAHAARARARAAVATATATAVRGGAIGGPRWWTWMGSDSTRTRAGFARAVTTQAEAAPIVDEVESSTTTKRTRRRRTAAAVAGAATSESTSSAASAAPATPAAATTADPIATDAPPKRKRGRPRKVAVAPAAAATAADAPSDDAPASAPPSPSSASTTAPTRSGSSSANEEVLIARVFASLDRDQASFLHIQNQLSLRHLTDTLPPSAKVTPSAADDASLSTEEPESHQHAPQTTKSTPKRATRSRPATSPTDESTAPNSNASHASAPHASTSTASRPPPTATPSPLLAPRRLRASIAPPADIVDAIIAKRVQRARERILATLNQLDESEKTRDGETPGRVEQPATARSSDEPPRNTETGRTAAAAPASSTPSSTPARAHDDTADRTTASTATPLNLDEPRPDASASHDSHDARRAPSPTTSPKTTVDVHEWTPDDVRRLLPHLDSPERILAQPQRYTFLSTSPLAALHAARLLQSFLPELDADALPRMIERAPDVLQLRHAQIRRKLATFKSVLPELSAAQLATIFAQNPSALLVDERTGLPAKLRELCELFHPIADGSASASSSSSSSSIVSRLLVDCPFLLSHAPATFVVPRLNLLYALTELSRTDALRFVTHYPFVLTQRFTRLRRLELLRAGAFLTTVHNRRVPAAVVARMREVVEARRMRDAEWSGDASDAGASNNAELSSLAASVDRSSLLNNEPLMAALLHMTDEEFVEVFPAFALQREAPVIPSPPPFSLSSEKAQRIASRAAATAAAVGSSSRAGRAPLTRAWRDPRDARRRAADVSSFDVADERVEESDEDDDDVKFHQVVSPRMRMRGKNRAGFVALSRHRQHSEGVLERPRSSSALAAESRVSSPSPSSPRASSLDLDDEWSRRFERRSPSPSSRSSSR